MFPIFTICFIIFLIVLNYQIHKSNNAQEQQQEKFWERERQANLTRRKDISNLDYITIPEDLFPLNLHTDAENELAALCNRKMLNLTGISNTDLKMEYGVQNLEELSAYDDNFTQLVRLLPIYANELLEQGQTADAQRILEFGIQHKADSKAIFTLLAQIYSDAGEPMKIQHLITVAGELDSLMQNSIIAALLEIQNTYIER